ncbi:MAG: large conductance mechanosensitive channel [Flavobacteriaceae bacterium]|jgi:large conductance mechanosensitive channel
MLKEFKAFILTKNVVDFAIAFLLAAAVGLVVTGFVNDIMMPLIGLFTGGADFSDMTYVLSEAVPAVMDGDKVLSELIPVNEIRYGAWINTIINLLIVGFVLFMISRAYKKSQKKKEAAPAPPAGPTMDQALLTEIRDLLKK